MIWAGGYACDAVTPGQNATLDGNKKGCRAGSLYIHGPIPTDSLRRAIVSTGQIGVVVGGGVTGGVRAQAAVEGTASYSWGVNPSTVIKPVILSWSAS